MSVVRASETAGLVASSFAHEINQPLTTISLCIEALDFLTEGATLDAERVRIMVKKLAGQVDRAEQLVQSLKGMLTGTDCEREACELNDCVLEAVEAAAELPLARGVDVRLNLSSDMPITALDCALIRQVIHNLLRNAFEAMERSETRSVCVTTKYDAERDMVELNVSDCGPGIAPQIAERLFHPFATSKSDGTGMGLAISRDIARLHGGTLNLLPNTSTGATFRLLLPRTATAANA